MKKFLMIFGLFLLLFILILFVDKQSNFKYYNDGLLYINEIMSSNNYTINDEDNSSPDYIEIYNEYDYDINLKGYYLSDSDIYNNKWEFPDIVIPSNSYLIIFASSKNKCDIFCHTNFKLNKSGGVVSLSNKDSKILSKIKYQETDSDTAYGYNGKKYVYYYTGTPNEKNDSEFSTIPIKRDKSDLKIRINEYTNNNISIQKNKNNEYFSVVELYNYDDKDIDLEGFYLSDSESNIMKYKFSNVTIKKDDYLIVYLSGKNTTDGEIHTNFSLSDKDTTLILSSNKQELIDQIKVEPLLPNMVYGYNGKKYIYSFEPTFGSKNSNKGESTIIKLKSSEKTVVINEISANALELRNVTDKDISLKDYKLKGNGSYLMTFPDVTIKANSYMVLYESDKYSYSNGKIYTGFKIGNTGEKISLYDNLSNTIDIFTSGKISSNMSYGLNDKGERVVFSNGTLGSKNSSSYYSGYAMSPIFSNNVGYVETNTKIKLDTTDGSTIYYTLDGSFPTNNSTKYNGEINIQKTTVVKAISYKDNYVNSDVVSRTYIVGRKHDMAVVSVSTNYDNLYGSSGLITNYRSDLEKKISFEFYEKDGTFGIMFNGGTKLVGQDSREFPQKSMAIYLRNNYGIDEMTYPLFEDHEVTTFSSFTLRNSGEDVVFLKFKDIFLTEVLKGQMDLDFQYYRPVVVYINGEYYGIYNIREKINESYLENNHEAEIVDLVKGNNDVRAGNFNDYTNLIYYVMGNDLSNQANYEKVKSRVDIQELINYWIVQTYYRNTDTGNIRFWRSYPDGKWRWVLFDQDWSMWHTTIWNASLTYPFKPYGHGTGGGFSTTLTYNLYKNAEFRDQYLKTFAYHLKNTFKPDRMLEIFNKIQKSYEKEMSYHVNRWYNDFNNEGISPLTMDKWYNNINTMKNTINQRYRIVLNSLRSEFNLSESEYQKYFGNL